MSNFMVFWKYDNPKKHLYSTGTVDSLGSELPNLHTKCLSVLLILDRNVSSAFVH